MSNQSPEHLLWDLIRDALRYREIRKHRNRGYPQPGIPFAMGWEIDEDEAGNEKPTGNTFYIREGQLDSELDKLVFAGDEDAPHPIDSIREPLIAALKAIIDE